MRQLSWNDLWFLPYAARWTVLLSIMAFIGARIRNRNRCPSGLRKACIVTSLGIS